MAVSAFSLFGELKLDRKDFTSGLSASEGELKSFKKSIEGVEKAVASAFENIGATMQSLGKGLTVGVTAPLSALSALATRSAVGFDTLRTQLTAATGSAATASDKFKELNQLAQTNAGVMTAGAVATYNFLKPLGLADGTINETIKAFGRLKAANPDVDLQRMATNLGQLFDQGFEQQDVKELLGNFPRALEIMKKAFNLKSSDRKGIAEEMRKLISSGALTKEDFYRLFAAGINADQFLSQVTDPIAVRFEKMKERIMLALEPLGAVILANLERITPYLVAFAEKASAAFTALGPGMQALVVTLAGVAAAAGPVLFVLGGIVSAIGSAVTVVSGLVAAAGTIGVIAAVIAGIGAALLPVIAIGSLFYEAWARNWELAKQVFWDGVASVTEIITAAIALWQGFWVEHGAAIVEHTTAAWKMVTDFLAGVMDVLAEYVRLGLSIINGDWSQAWEAFLGVVTNVWTLITTLIGNALNAISTLISAFGPILLKGMTWAFTQVLTMVSAAAKALIDIFLNLPAILISLIPKFISAGMQIGAAIQTGIANGIRNFFTPAIGDIGGGVGPDTSGISGIVEKFKSLFSGGGPTAGLEGGLGGFLAAVPTQANTATTALDKVEKKIKSVKAAAVKPISDATMRAAEKVGMEAQKKAAENAKKVYGKAVTNAPGGILLDVSGLNGAALLKATQPLPNFAGTANDISLLEKVAKAASEGKLYIEIQGNGLTTGAQSATPQTVINRYAR